MATIAEFFTNIGINIDGQEGLKSFSSSLESTAKVTNRLINRLKILETVAKRVSDSLNTTSTSTSESSGLKSITKSVNDSSKAVDTLVSKLGELRGVAKETKESLKGGTDSKDAVRTAEEVSETKKQHLKGEQQKANTELERSSDRQLLKANLLQRSLSGIAGYLKNIGTGLKELRGEAVEKSLGLKNFEYATGLSKQTLQNWERIAKIMGTNPKEVISTISTFQDKFNALLQEGSVPSSAWAKLGINPLERDPMKQISAIQAALKSVDADTRSTARYLLEQMGVGEEMFVLLQKMNDAGIDLEKYNPYGGRNLSEEDITALDDYGKASRELSSSWKDLKDKLGSAMAGVMTPFIKGLTAILDTIHWVWKAMGPVGRSSIGIVMTFIAANAALASFALSLLGVRSLLAGLGVIPGLGQLALFFKNIIGWLGRIIVLSRTAAVAIRGVAVAEAAGAGAGATGAGMAGAAGAGAAGAAGAGAAKAGMAGMLAAGFIGAWLTATTMLTTWGLSKADEQSESITKGLMNFKDTALGKMIKGTFTLDTGLFKEGLNTYRDSVIGQFSSGDTNNTYYIESSDPEGVRREIESINQREYLTASRQSPNATLR